MSWEDIKKKKDRKNNTSINTFSNSTSNNTQMSSWEKIKKKKENTISSSITSKNSYEEKENTIWDNMKNSAKSLWEDIKNSAKNRVTYDSTGISNQTEQKVLTSNDLTDSDKSFYIAGQKSGNIEENNVNNYDNQNTYELLSTNNTSNNTVKQSNNSTSTIRVENVLDENTLLESLSNLSAVERVNQIRATTNNEKEFNELNQKVIQYKQSKEAQEKAQKINEDIENGNYWSAVGHVLSGIPTKARDASTTTFAAVNSLVDPKQYKPAHFQQDPDELLKTNKALSSKYEETTANINNGIVQTASNVSGTIGGIVPSILSDIVMPGSGRVMQAINVGAEAYQDTLNDDSGNKKQAILTGLSKGGTSYLLEGVTGGNFLGKGSLDDFVIKNISTKLSSKSAKKVASKLYEIVGEIGEEQLENQAGYVIDKVINNKDFPTIEEWLNEANETNKNTFWTTVILNALGLGGDTYDEVVKYETDTQTKEMIKEAEKIIEQDSLKIDTQKLTQENNSSNLQQDVAKKQNTISSQQVTSIQPKNTQKGFLEQIDNNIPEYNNSYINKDNLPLANNQETIYNNVERESDINGYNSNEQRRIENIYKQENAGEQRESRNTIDSGTINSIMEGKNQNDAKALYKKYEQEARINQITNLSNQQQQVRQFAKNKYEKDLIYYDDSSTQFSGGLSKTDNHSVFFGKNIIDEYGDTFLLGHEIGEDMLKNHKDKVGKTYETLIEKIQDDNNFPDIFLDYIFDMDENIKNIYIEHPEAIAKELICDTLGFMQNNNELGNNLPHKEISNVWINKLNTNLLDEMKSILKSHHDEIYTGTKNSSSTNVKSITGDDIAVRDMLKQEKPTIEDAVGNTREKTQEKQYKVNDSLLDYLDQKHINYELDENNNITYIEDDNAIKDYNKEIEIQKQNKNNKKETLAKNIQDKYKLMEIGKRQYEKLLRKEKPTEKEKITVDRLLKGEIENSEIPASVNRQRVVDLYNAKAKFYNVEQEIKTQRKEIVKSYRDLAKNMVKNISTWKDKNKGIQYQINTMKRNLRDIIPDKSEADALYNEYFKPITKNNAIIEKEISKYNDRISKYEINNVESQYIQMIGENRYNPDTKLPIEKIEEFYDKHKSKIDIKKCQEAVEEFRTIYDELIVKINNVLIENGYKPIEYRQGYFPHFVEDKANTILGKFAEKLGWKINADTLPTDISGITDQFKPGKAWTAFSQQRKGDETDYNALKGFDNYVRGAMDVIHHTKDIQKLRALENEIRYQYSEKGIQEQIDNIYDDHESSIEEKQEKINEIFDNIKNNPMGNLATELRDYTNNLANKKATADRGLEHSAGRQTYSIMTNIQNRVSANMVGANISSAMTNFIPITQAWSQTSTKNMMKAIKESIAIQFNDDGFSNNSTFLTNRTEQADRLYKTGLDKANDKLGYMFDVVDSFTSNVIVRAKYYDNIDAGMNTYEALDNADEFAKDVIAGRSKGDMPTIFNQKNPLTKLFTAFQLEVNNQYGYMLKDLPADLGDEAKEKLVGAFVKMFLGAFLYNMLSEKITGNKSAFSPIDIALDSYNTLSNDEISTGDKIKSIGTDLLGETPFLGGIAGGGRLPIQGAIPYDDPFSMVLETISTASDVFDGDEEQKQTAIKSLTKEWSKPLYYVALPFAGGQLKKTIEGVSMYLNDVPGSYTNSGDLRFTVDDDIASKVKATIFGTYANPYAQDYVDSGFKTISKDNIDEMVGLDMNSSEYREYKKGLSKSNKTEEKLNYINSLDLTDSQKTLAANNINKNLKKTIDMSEYGNYSSYDEYTYARDNPEKYSVVTQITDYDNYVKYKDNIADIKEKYSSEAGYESQERRTAVHDYINGLNLNVCQKLMLEKMAGGYSIKNYKNYIYEYLETTDLTSSEKYAIWEELFN